MSISYKIRCYHLDGTELKSFYQWDINQSILIKGVEDPTSVVFHVSGGCRSTAYIVEPTVSGEDVILKIPNKALAKSEPITIYIYQGDGDGGFRTTTKIHIPVLSRIEPDDYVYEGDGNSSTVWQQTLEMLNGLKGGQTGQIASKASDNDYDFEFVDLPEGGSGGAPKIQKYTINAAEYYDKTSKHIVNFRGRKVAEGLFDVTLTVSVELIGKDASYNHVPNFTNQPISYEAKDMASIVLADLKEIVLYFELEEENEDTGEMEREEVYMNASYFVAALSDYGDTAKIAFRYDYGLLYAEVLARYEGVDNDTALEIVEIAEIYREFLKAATLYYVPYEKGDETIAEVSI